MKQPIKKGVSPTKPNVKSKEELDVSLLINRDNSLLSVPKECVKELEDQDLAYKWLDIIDLNKSQGMHKRGWAPYKFKTALPGSGNPFAVNSGQYDGYLVRKQLVLGVMPRQEANLLKARNQLRTKMQSDPVKLKRDELREMARQHGVNTKIESNEDMQDDDNE
jgi:hypothetical protein